MVLAVVKSSVRCPNLDPWRQGANLLHPVAWLCYFPAPAAERNQNSFTPFPDAAGPSWLHLSSLALIYCPPLYWATGRWRRLHDTRWIYYCGPDTSKETLRSSEQREYSILSPYNPLLPILKLSLYILPQCYRPVPPPPRPSFPAVHYTILSHYSVRNLNSLRILV